MQNEPFFLLVRCVFTGLFLTTILVGLYLWKNYDRLFAVDPDMPSETGSSRTYSKLQVFSVWTHVFLLTGAFTFVIH